MRAYGHSYISVPLDSPYGMTAHCCSIIFPKVGDIYDFTDHEYAWVCGAPYDTVRNGRSSPVNVANKKIKITDYRKGDPSTFGMIEFEEII